MGRATVDHYWNGRGLLLQLVEPRPMDTNIKKATPRRRHKHVKLVESGLLVPVVKIAAVADD